MELDNSLRFVSITDSMYLYILVLLTLAVLRPLTTLMHEIGHAIPSLIYTREMVTIYVGSHGDPKKSLQLKLGRLKIFFKYNPVLWKRGLCVSEQKDVFLDHRIIIILSGPLMSLIIGITSLSLMFTVMEADYAVFLTLMIAVSSFFDFFQNIIPNEDAIILHNGSEVYNDGQQLKLLFAYRNLPDGFDKSVELYKNNDFAAAGALFEEMIHSGLKKDIVYRLAISSYLQIKEYDKANTLNKEFTKRHHKRLDSNDHFNSGLIRSHKGDLTAAIEAYSKSLSLDHNNANSYNNRGYTYNLMEQYENALADFNKALEYEENFAYALNNRGLARFKLGDVRGGLDDLKRSLELDNSNSYCYMNLGIYHFDLGEYSKALEYFERANSLDKDTYKLAEHLAQTKKRIKTNK